MKIIGKDGKLFGKINIIDFLVLLVLAAAVIFAGVRILDRGHNASMTIEEGEDKLPAPNLRFTVVCEEMPLETAENIVEKINARPRTILPEFNEIRDADETAAAGETEATEETEAAEESEEEGWEVQPRRITNGGAKLNAQIVDAVIEQCETSEDGKVVNLRFTIEGTANFNGAGYVLGTQELRVGKDHIVKTVDIECNGKIIFMEELHD